MPINKFILFVVFVLFFAELNFSYAQETAGKEKLTLKNLNKKISDPHNSDKIKLKLNTKKPDKYSSSYLKDFPEIKNNIILSKNFDDGAPYDKNTDLPKISTRYKDRNVDIRKYFPEEYIPWESSKHFGWAVIDELTFNILFPWALARFGRDWADSGQGERWPFIGFNSIWSNLTNGWNYDGDNFTTNYFAHPFGGSLFYNSGRANGYNFWESGAFALGGSFLWETFMETNQPAINDWVNTGLGGAAFGEILFRLSTLATDNTARGGHRVWTEIAGGIFNPVRLFQRLVTGEASRVFPNPTYRRPKNLEIKFDAGTRVLFNEDSTHNPDGGQKELEGIFNLTVQYGNQFKDAHTTPFSHFYYNVGFASSSPNLTSMNAVGSLVAFQISKKKNGQKHNLETSLNYNYFANPGFLYGNVAFVEQLNSYYPLGKGWSLRSTFGARIIPMGGTPDDYFLDSTDGRNYDMGQGLGALGRLTIHKGGWDIFYIDYEMDYIWTQSEPSFSKHFLQNGAAFFQLPITDFFVMGLSAGYYKRKSYYFYPSDFFAFPTPDVSYETPIIKVFFRTRVL